jgi:hypothetical protein
MSLSSLYLSAAISLRLLNPHATPVDASLLCDGGAQSVRVEARDVADLGSGCSFVDALLPLKVLETSVEEGEEWQRDVGSEADCGGAAMAVPLFACKSGVATAAVEAVDGASYQWNAQGATILEGAGTHRVVVQLTDPKTATLTCVITTAECTKTALGTLSIREPLVVRELNVPTGINVDQPVTLTWSYEGSATPVTQLLTGTAFAAPVPLAGNVRSHTFTPRQTGTRTVELHASYATQVAEPPKKRRRAVGGSVIATQCPSVRTSRTMEVRGCGVKNAIITAPADIGAGESFEALVNVDDDQKVEWSVENGSFDWISHFGERAQVRAGASGILKISARIERTPSCFASTEVELPIILPAGQCAIVPTAQLALTTHDCDSATVRADFTGTPPFSGIWSDGTQFVTNSMLAIRKFSRAGTYGITRFHDSSCFGTVSGTPSIDALRTTVLLAKAGGSCGNHVLRATFAGVPPFTGRWSDGQTFTTSDFTIERTVRGGDTWSVIAHDSVCAQNGSSRAIELPPPPRVSVHGWGLCQILPNQGVTVGSVFVGGEPPYRLEWSNGLVTTGNNPHLWQQFPPTTSSVEYDLVRAFANGCEVDIESSKVSIIHRQSPVIAPRDRHNVLCVGQPHLQKLSVPPSPGAILEWSANGVGIIYRGQGQQEVEFVGNSPGWTQLSLKTTYPDHVCAFETTSKDEWYFSPPVWIDNLRFEPSTIKAGGTARLRYDHNNVAASFALHFPPDRMSDWNHTYFTVTDTHGPGTFTIRMVWTDPCSGDYEETATLTITE